MKRLSNRVRIGSVAGAKDKSGYVIIGIKGRLYKAHRLAWLHFYGEWPSFHLDHINGITSDNRIFNLRQCDDFENMQNQGMSTKNKSGYMGVSFDKERCKWQASISVRGKSIGLGRFDCPEDAHRAYLNAKKSMHTFQPKIRDSA